MIRLDEYTYEFAAANNPQLKIKKLYSEPIPSDEADIFIQGILKDLFSEIKKRTRP